ncbi:MAG: monothiol bacilliredoxin BrxC family protein, partial [Bacteroidota bacterium]
EEIRTLSKKTPCAIYKYSPDCGICKFIKIRIESDWSFSNQELIPYLIDVAQYKQLAQEVADAFQNPHQSPQVLLIRDGICTYDAEGFDITVEELRECYEDSF